MRACAACFWFRRREGTREGECMNRPPVIVPIVHDDPRGKWVELLTVRPTVLEDDYCHFFSHPRKVAAQ